MSGGYFDYEQYKIDEIAIAVEDLIFEDSLDENKYPKEVIEEFKAGLVHLKKAAIYAQRIDWLVCGDDGEVSFIERLKSDLDELTL